MTKVYVYYYEAYPVFALDDSEKPESMTTLELSKADLADCKRVFAEYDAWQRRLRACTRFI